MLEIVQIENRSQIEELFADYDPRRQSWLVSDLRTKFELQEKILERDGQYVDESVLRASDLWKILLKRLAPELRLVSPPFLRSLLRTVMDEQAEVLGVNSSAEETVFAYMNQLAPIVLHPAGTKLLNEWFETHPEAAARWKDWAMRARFCALQLLEGHRVIPASWITSYLQNFEDLERVWDIPLIVDLSGEFSRVEAEILKTLSRFVNIKVLSPYPTWREEYKYLLQPYEDLEAEVLQPQTLKPVKKTAKTVEVLRFSGMLAETKNAVGQIRRWLEQGVAADRIAVIAPDIELYWPVMQAFLQEEGIPCQKDSTHKLQSLPAVTRWLSLLRSKSGRLSTSDIEVSFFDRPESQSLRYEEFKSLFKSLYVTEDLGRNSLIHKIYCEQVDLQGLVERDVFVGKALSFWTAHEPEAVQQILRELLQNALAQTRLSWKEWLSYLESIVALKEFTLEKGQTAGVLATKLMAAHSEKSQYRIFLGLSDEALKVYRKTQLMGQDYFDLAKDIGFYLENPDQSGMEFELRLLAEANSVHDIYCFGGTDFSGSLQSPSTFWMSCRTTFAADQDHEALSLPMENRWDRRQYAPPTEHRSWLQGRHELVQERIAMDLGEKELPALKLAEKPRLSASTFESYLQCPFKFAAQRQFRLQDLPDIDLDVDHRTRGQLAHALFERLTREPMRFDWSVAELDKALDEIRDSKDLIFADDRLWQPLKSKHIQLGLRFLQFEQEWRSQFPKVKTLAREVAFVFYLNPQTGELSREESEGAFKISGQIDRVDGDEQGHLVVLDYKSSSGNISAHGSWLKNHEIQLLLYGLALEQSMVDGVEGEVVGLFYFLFKTLQRKGFRVEFDDPPYPAGKRKDKAGTFETKEMYLTELSRLLVEVIDRIARGDISPKPKKLEICTSCEWRRLCRAPHLN